MKRGNLSANTPPEDDPLAALAWVHRAGAEDELLRDVREKLRRRRARRLTTGAALLVVIALGGLGARLAQSPSATGAAHGVARAEGNTSVVATGLSLQPTPTTTVSRPATRTLPDGSLVELNAGAEITVDFSAAFRRITLVRGDAHFQVTKNPQRPFVVRAGDAEVRAVGTAFAVQLGTGLVEVLVTEGRVKVSPVLAATSTSGEPPSALVDAGRHCLVDAGGVPRLTPASPLTLATQLAWRIPQLEFSRTPLHEVIALVNEHARAFGSTTFAIADAELRDIKLTGILRADNTAGLERLLETSFNVRLEHRGTQVVLHRR